MTTPGMLCTTPTGRRSYRSYSYIDNLDVRVVPELRLPRNIVTIHIACISNERVQTQEYSEEQAGVTHAPINRPSYSSEHSSKDLLPPPSFEVSKRLCIHVPVGRRSILCDKDKGTASSRSSLMRARCARIA